jgi:hypothetical protein
MVGRRITRPGMSDLNGKFWRPGMLVATLLFEDAWSMGEGMDRDYWDGKICLQSRTVFA